MKKLFLLLTLTYLIIGISACQKNEESTVLEPKNALSLKSSSTISISNDLDLQNFVNQANQDIDKLIFAYNNLSNADKINFYKNTENIYDNFIGDQSHQNYLIYLNKVGYQDISSFCLDFNLLVFYHNELMNCQSLQGKNEMQKKEIIANSIGIYLQQIEPLSLPNDVLETSQYRECVREARREHHERRANNLTRYSRGDISYQQATYNHHESRQIFLRDKENCKNRYKN